MDEPHRWKTIDDVIVSFTIPGRIDDEVWNAFLADITAQRPKCCLVLCMGKVEVDAAQRRRSTHAVMRTNSSVVVLTDNRMTRGLAIAVAWFGAKLDAYAWSDLGRALEQVDIASGTRQRLQQEARRFHAAFGHLED